MHLPFCCAQLGLAWQKDVLQIRSVTCVAPGGCPSHEGLSTSLFSPSSVCVPCCLLRDPAKGRTNMELREKFILADGASQGMAAFRPRGRRSRPSSRGASPNRSTSVSSQAGQAASPQVPATSTPKVGLGEETLSSPWAVSQSLEYTSECFRTLEFVSFLHLCFFSQYGK